MEYDKINDLFEPIFQWLKNNYPNGAYFLVDKNCAKLYSNENITVFSEEIKNYSKNMLESIAEDNDEKKILFRLNSDLLDGKRNKLNNEPNSNSVDNVKKN